MKFCCGIVLFVCILLINALDHGVNLPTTLPLNIAHRGASGLLPEYTLEAYQLAIDEGADVIECDICVTKDLQLVCLHESWMNGTTDAALKFPEKLNTYFVIDAGRFITDYFSVDLTLAEIQTINMRQRFDNRDPNYNYQFSVTSLEETIQLVKGATRPVGLYLETKDPNWVNSLDIIKNANTTLEDLLVSVLQRYGFNSSTDPCFLQSFSRDSIIYLSKVTQLPLVQLLSIIVSNDTLQEWATYCYGIGPSRSLIITTNPQTGYIGSVSDLVAVAHQYGLRVHPYTFRNDADLPWDYKIDPNLEYQQFLNLGVDGYFTDFPGTLSRFLNASL